MKYSENILKNSESLRQYPNSEREVEMPFILDHMPVPPRKVLDIGCCDSDLVYILNGLGFDARGIDCRPAPNYGDEKWFDVGDARHLPYDDKSFDIVTCVSALEHFGFPENGYHSDTELDDRAQYQAFGEMLRVLKDGGLLFLTLPFGKYDPQAGWDRWVKFYDSDKIIDLIQRTYTVKPVEVEVVEIQCDIRDDNGWHTATMEEAAANISRQEVTSNAKIIIRRIK